MILNSPILVIPEGGKIPVIVQSITSWNDLNSTMWSDGWCFGPFMTDEPLLLKSPDENLLFWDEKWERVGSISKFIHQRILMNWRNPKRAVKPSEADYLHALESGMAAKKQQIHYIRKRLWWKANDPIRKDPTACMTPAQLENLAILVEMLPFKKPDDRLLKAEALRQLSRFDESIKLLDEADFTERYEKLVEFIRSRAQAGDFRVAMIHGPERKNFPHRPFELYQEQDPA